MHGEPRDVHDLQFNTSSKFTAAHRLKRQNGFDHVIHAENLGNSCFKVFFVLNDKENGRLGIIVGKKILSGSTDRNRLKRIIRETFRNHGIKLCKLDVVVMVRRFCSKKSEVLSDNLKILFTKVENKCAEW